MIGNKNLIVTCVYNNLYGTKIGGRHGRNIHYTNSLATITKMNQDIVVYTTEKDKNILLENETIKNYNKIRFFIYDLFSDDNHEYFQNHKEKFKTPIDRCLEIQHCKIKWMNSHLSEGYEFIYWIDAGLSHSGLFPSKFRDSNFEYDNSYSNILFTEKIFQNLNKIGEKIVVLGGNQNYHIFERNYNSEHGVPLIYPERFHIIGGFFGGKSQLIKTLFEDYSEVFLEMKKFELIESEELLLTLLANKNPNLFNIIEFTTWHHEESDMSQYNKEDEIYFYQIFENLSN